MKYEGEIAKELVALKNFGLGKTHEEQLAKFDVYISKFNSAISELEKATKTALEKTDLKERAVVCRDKVNPKLDALREIVDEMQVICDKAIWPYPNYQDILFKD